MRRITVLALAAGAVLLPAVPASAHVEISPATAAVKQYATYTLTVPNERADQDTIGLDVTLPSGFVLGYAEQLPGWKTTVDANPDGTARAVHWTGGAIPPKTFGTFALRGRTPAAATSLAFKAVQRYQRESESWTGAPGSDTPAPVLTVTTSGTPAAPAGGQVAAAPPLSGSAGKAGLDSLARSRAALALVLAVAALLALAAAGVLLAITRRRPAVPAPKAPADPTNDQAKTPQPHNQQPHNHQPRTPPAKPKRKPAPAR
ncbi:MAG: hypothetical protein QOD41_3161 [Cryptosporangiaceae bacterium]|nr:hypothetical protein [Cryptosporangiaceae bacterium]